MTNTKLNIENNNQEKASNLLIKTLEILPKSYAVAIQDIVNTIKDNLRKKLKNTPENTKTSLERKQDKIDALNKLITQNPEVFANIQRILPSSLGTYINQQVNEMMRTLELNQKNPQQILKPENISSKKTSLKP